MPGPIAPSAPRGRLLPRVRRGPAGLVATMLLVVVGIAAAAWWDEERESAAALEDFAQEQATLARSVAAELQSRLAVTIRDARAAAEAAAGGRALPRSLAGEYLALHVVGDGPEAAAPPPPPGALAVRVPVAPGETVDLALTMSRLLGGFRAVESPGSVMLLLLPPGERTFRATDGREVAAPPVREALDRGVSALRLPPPDAAALGLPRRTAMAGLAWVDSGEAGRWGVAVVANAQRLRDREQRARRRLALTALLAGGVVFTFGGLALRRQRKELDLERELAVADLQRQQDERLDRADRAATLGTIAMGIAHEISTPLGVIAGRAEQLLPAAGSDERAARSVRAILEQTDRIHQVIRAFLGLVRGDRPPEGDLAPAELASRALALCEHRFSRAGVSLSASVPERLPTVRGEPSLLEHALVNLLLNACDACDRGGRVELSVTAGDGSVIFAVADDGVGIAARDAARVTEPFFTTKPSGAGSGLGLAIVAEIAKHHRGSLALAARSPRGTVARLEIPMAGRAE